MRPMSTQLILIVTVACALMGASASAADDNLLPNPGFETAPDGTISSWVKPDYWSGELTSSEHAESVRGGKRSASLKAIEKDGRHWGRMHSALVDVSPGLNYRFSIWAKGTGSIKLGVIHYVPKLPDQPHYRIQWMEEGVALTDEWSQTALDFSPVSAQVQRIALMVEVEGEAATASVDDASLTVARKFEGQIETSSHYVMVKRAEPVSITIRALTTDGSPVSGNLSVVSGTAEEPVTESIALGDDGAAQYSFIAKPEMETGLHTLSFVSADMGSAAKVYVDVVDEALHEQFAQIASAAKIGPLPSHVLFLGDSLTDMSRGFNYVDQVEFWLQSVHGAAATVRNAGVGGDYITRVWDRLNGSPTVYRLNAYDGLYEPRPTRIFIFLGHNDSKLKSSTGFTEAVVSPEDYENLHRKAIEKLRADTGAPITIISSTSSVYEITEPMAQRLLKSRGSASLFGKPEVLEQYNEITRALAAEMGCGYLDVYMPTKAHPDKPSLFTSDGVHMTLAGNHLIALKVLQYLAE